MSGSGEVSREISEILTWIAGHNATCTERHQAIMESIKNLRDTDVAQMLEIKALELKQEETGKELGGIKVKLAFIAGIGAAGGGAIGSALFKAFGG